MFFPSSDLPFQVKSFRLPLLGIFAFCAAICMYTATFVTPDPRMPQVFSSKDNYERFLPTLAKRYERKFNPFRLKVRVHLGINSKDPIDRGTTPDYNDCFFNCAGQKPNYVDIFASAGDLDSVWVDYQTTLIFYRCLSMLTDVYRRVCSVFASCLKHVPAQLPCQSRY